jgi:hypothetical protein
VGQDRESRLFKTDIALRTLMRFAPCTDGGLVPRSRGAARGKMEALAAGAAIVRRELRA